MFMHTTLFLTSNYFASQGQLESWIDQLEENASKSVLENLCRSLTSREKPLQEFCSRLSTETLLHIEFDLIFLKIINATKPPFR